MALSMGAPTFLCWNYVEWMGRNESYCKWCRVTIHWDDEAKGTMFGISSNRRLYMKRYTFTHDWYGKWFGLGFSLYWGKSYWKVYIHLGTVRLTLTRNPKLRGSE